MSIEVAREILRQLGGKQFMAMVGANHPVASDDSLTLRLPYKLARDGINAVRITLNGLDLYDVTYYKIRGVDVKEVKEESNIYADQLRERFEEVTGLATSL